MNRNSLASADFAQALVRLPLDADAIERHAEDGRKVGAHLVDVRRELGPLQNDGRVDVTDGETFGANDLDGASQQVDARGALPPRVRIGKVAADVARTRSTKDRVGDRVAHRVGIRVPCEAAIEGNRHAAENQRASLDKAMQIVAHARSTGARWSAAATNGLRDDEILSG